MAAEDPLPAGVPLLAYGANGSPERLASKLPHARVAALAARLRGWAVVHSAHVSPYGAVPATLVPAPDAVADVHVLLLDGRAGIGSLDATEPNYVRRTLEGVRLEADRLGDLERVEAYVSRWGPLLIEGHPVPLGARTQDELRAILHRGA